MRIDILSLFPDLFAPILGTSILGRAAASGAVEYHAYDIRHWALDKHNRVDDRPFGGGPGMVMMCQPLHDAVTAVEKMSDRLPRRIVLSPQGERLRQSRVEELAGAERLLLVSGHYEGVDERFLEVWQPLQISIGDYVLSGGELPALVLIDAIVRLLPGVLGHEDSAAEDSFSLRDVGKSTSGEDSPFEMRSKASGGGQKARLLDCPHYTRPREWMGRPVPEVLLSGDHEKIAAWRLEQMIERTRERRPDLLENRDP